MLELLRDHWALVAGSVLLTALVLQAILIRAGRTPAAQLRRALHELEAKRQNGRRVMRRLRRARRRCEHLERRVQSVRPIRLEQARNELSDSEALLKIERNQVMVAENHVRRIIVEQFPPSRQAKLRKRCRVEEAPSDGSTF